MAPVAGSGFVAERRDAAEPLVSTSGQPSPLATDSLGYLKVTTAGGVGTKTIDGASVGLIHDAVNGRLLDELLITLRAILNHQRAISSAQGVTVDESAPL